MRHPGFVRNFESVLQLLSERGHRVHVAFDPPFRLDKSGGVIPRLAVESESITFGPVPDRSREAWGALGTRLRLGVDFLRYLEPRYAGATKLRARAEVRVGVVLRCLGRVAARWPRGPAALARLLGGVDASLPVSPRAVDFVRARSPDVLLVTPLVELGEPQTDFVRAGRDLGVPTGLCVASWDNLTNKGVVSEVPDLVTVWNDAQAREAVELHRVPPERVVVTGAQSYDHWFDWRPSLERAAFVARAGLPDDRPFLLYLCSSVFIAPDEASFVRCWLHRLRERPEPELREAGVLVRPHPQHAEQWRDADLSGFGPVAVFPSHGADPVDVGSRRDFFDSIHHCTAVVGVNTSALIESAIVGRPVFTYLAPEFRETQEGTLHFSHLTDDGPLSVARSFDEHAAQLAAALAGSGDGLAGGKRREREKVREFLCSFLRPQGLDVPATPRLVDAVECLGRTATQPRPWLPVTRPLRVVLAPLAGLAFLDVAARRAVLRGLRKALGVPTVRTVARRPELTSALRHFPLLADAIQTTLDRDVAEDTLRLERSRGMGSGVDEPAAATARVGT